MPHRDKPNFEYSYGTPFPDNYLHQHVMPKSQLQVLTSLPQIEQISVSPLARAIILVKDKSMTDSSLLNARFTFIAAKAAITTIKIIFFIRK